jgi:teichoic acid transport system permease protein
MTTTDTATELRPLNPRLSTAEYLSALWRRRDFMVAMPAEQLRATHQNTLLGNIWHLGNPLLTVGVSYVVFGVVLGTNRGIENFTLWLTVGVFTFHLTSGSVQSGARSIATNQGLMRSIRFPRAILPISAILSNLFTFGFQLCVLGFVALATGEGVSQRWLALPLVLAIHTAFNLGLAFIAARLNDSYRDVQRVTPFMFRILQFVSGVMIPIDRFAAIAEEHPALRPLIVHNPLRRIIEMYRWVFMGDPMPVGEVARLVLLSAIVLAAGFSYFRGAEWRYGRN